MKVNDDKKYKKSKKKIEFRPTKYGKVLKEKCSHLSAETRKAIEDLLILICKKKNIDVYKQKINIYKQKEGRKSTKNKDNKVYYIKNQDKDVFIKNKSSFREYIKGLITNEEHFKDKMMYRHNELSKVLFSASESKDKNFLLQRLFYYVHTQVQDYDAGKHHDKFVLVNQLQEKELNSSPEIPKKIKHKLSKVIDSSLSIWGPKDLEEQEGKQKKNGKLFSNIRKQISKKFDTIKKTKKFVMHSTMRDISFNMPVKSKMRKNANLIYEDDEKDESDLMSSINSENKMPVKSKKKTFKKHHISSNMSVNNNDDEESDLMGNSDIESANMTSTDMKLQHKNILPKQSSNMKMHMPNNSMQVGLNTMNDLNEKSAPRNNPFDWDNVFDLAKKNEELLKKDISKENSSLIVRQENKEIAKNFETITPFLGEIFELENNHQSRETKLFGSLQSGNQVSGKKLKRQSYNLHKSSITKNNTLSFKEDIPFKKSSNMQMHMDMKSKYRVNNQLMKGNFERNSSSFTRKRRSSIFSDSITPKRFYTSKKTKGFKQVGGISKIYQDFSSSKESIDQENPIDLTLQSQKDINDILVSKFNGNSINGEEQVTFKVSSTPLESSESCWKYEKKYIKDASVAIYYLDYLDSIIFENKDRELKVGIVSTDKYWNIAKVVQVFTCNYTYNGIGYDSVLIHHIFGKGSTTEDDSTTNYIYGKNEVVLIKENGTDKGNSIEVTNPEELEKIAKELGIDYIEIPREGNMQMNTQDSAGRVKKPVLELGLVYSDVYNDELDNEGGGNTQCVTDITSVKYGPAVQVGGNGEYDDSGLLIAGELREANRVLGEYAEHEN
ncbi:MAG: hypothetical protein AAFO15_00380 [Pseudomonadota bacterium]